MNNVHYCGEKKSLLIRRDPNYKRSHVDNALLLSLSDSDVKRSCLITTQLINSFWIHFVLKGSLHILKVIYKFLCQAFASMEAPPKCLTLCWLFPPHVCLISSCVILVSPVLKQTGFRGAYSSPWVSKKQILPSLCVSSFFKIYLFYGHDSFLHVCICKKCIAGAKNSQKRVWDPLKLEVQRCERSFGLWELNPGHQQKQQGLLTSQSPRQLQHLYFQ